MSPDSCKRLNEGPSLSGKEVLVAATGIQNVIAYAGVAQVSNDGKGMQVYEGRRIPLIYWDPSGEGLPSLEAFQPADSDSWQHRFLDCLASAALTNPIL